MNDKYLSIKEAAVKLEVHWQTVRNYIKAGDIKAVKIGRTVRIPQSEFQRLIDNQSKEKREIELRYMISNFDDLETKLKSLHIAISGHSHIMDHYYCDRRIKTLADNQEYYENPTGYSLRIRQNFIDYSNTVYQTLEVKKLAGPTYKDHTNCLEAEMEVKDFDTLEKIILMMNHKRFLVIDKERFTYRYKNFVIAIDKIKNFGYGLEIEKMSSEDVDKVKAEIREIARNLGYSQEQEIEKSLTFKAIELLADFSKD
jgi:predicted adenylyl cyclase CyaB